MSVRRTANRIAAAAIGLLLTVPAAPGQAAEELRLPLKLTSFAVNLDAPVGAPSSGRLDITINRWSTDGERDRLLQALQEKGTDRLLEALQKVSPPVGVIRSEGSLGWDLSYARIHPGEDGGYRLVFATDRPIGFAEAANRTRSSEYEFMLSEIHLDRNGQGQGKLAVRAKVTWDEKTKTIEIENYDIEPIRLTKVQELR
jgi:hypothetical protein